MPQFSDGQLVKTRDGLPMVWSEKFQRGYPPAVAKQMGLKIVEPGSAAIPGGDPDRPFDPLSPGSDARARVAVGIGPALEGVRNLERMELPEGPTGKRINPFNKHAIATVIGNLDEGKLGELAPIGAIVNPAANVLGGNEYQGYQQASKSFEATMLPIFSGAAVSQSEAGRQIQANLPELGNTPEILAQKAKQRAMMINGAADLAGRPRPYPEIGTWNFRDGAPSDQLVLPESYYKQNPDAPRPTPAAKRAPVQGDTDIPLRPGRVIGKTQSGQWVEKPTNWRDQLSPQQRAAAQTFKGTKAGSGTALNPYFPTNATEYDSVPGGKYYVHQDGSMRLKPKR